MPLANGTLKPRGFFEGRYFLIIPVLCNCFKELLVRIDTESAKIFNAQVI